MRKTPESRTARSTRGLTLLEVLAAVALLGIWFVALASMNLHSLRAEGTAMRRIEAGLLLIDVDFISSVNTLFVVQKSTPYEIGLGWTVKLGKESFIGRDALRAQKAAR